MPAGSASSRFGPRLVGTTTVCGVLLRIVRRPRRRRRAGAGLRALRAADRRATRHRRLFLCVRGLTPLKALVPGFLFGIGFMYVLIFWMRVVGPDAWIALATLEASFYGVLGAVMALVTRLRWWPVWSAAAWVGSRLCVPAGRRAGCPGDGSPRHGGHPRGPGVPLGRRKWHQLPPGVGGVVLAWAALHFRARPGAAATLVLGLSLLACAPALVPWHSRADGSVTVAAVQGNVPGDGYDSCSTSARSPGTTST